MRGLSQESYGNMLRDHPTLCDAQRMANEIIGTRAAMGILGVGRDTVIRMVIRGDLPYREKLPGKNGSYLFDRAIVEIIARQRGKARAS
jgi:predicted DNA-binding transcriptional regulator AlpA